MSEHTYGGLTDAQLDALHAAATPGPMEFHPRDTCFYADRGALAPDAYEMALEWDKDSFLQANWPTLPQPDGRGDLLVVDAALIAAACNALPHLTRRIRDLEADLATASRGYAARVRELEAQLAAAREDSARLDYWESRGGVTRELMDDFMRDDAARGAK